MSINVKETPDKDLLSQPVAPLGVTYDPQRDMQLIAVGDLTNADLVSVDGALADRQAKMFLISEARQELNRVVKYTKFLDTLEDKFMTQVENRLQERPNDLMLITSAMEIVQKSITRSNDLISQIIKDEQLKTLVINVSNTSVTDSFNTVVGSGDLDATSRDNIRNAAAVMLDSLTKMEMNTDVIEVEPTEVGNSGESD